MPPPEEDIVIGGEEPVSELDSPRRRGRPRKVGRKKSAKKTAKRVGAITKKQAPAAKKAPATKKRAPAKRATAAKKTTRRPRKQKKLVAHAVNLSTQALEGGRVLVVVGRDGYELGRTFHDPNSSRTDQHFTYYEQV